MPGRKGRQALAFFTFVAFSGDNAGKRQRSVVTPFDGLGGAAGCRKE
jgi:hypothetical protein